MLDAYATADRLRQVAGGTNDAGYPPSGLNPVSVWIEKYRQAYQLDGRSSALPEASPDHGAS